MAAEVTAPKPWGTGGPSAAEVEPQVVGVLVVGKQRRSLP